MSDTPRTDASVVKGIIYRDGWRSVEAHRDDEWVSARLSRELEHKVAESVALHQQTQRILNESISENKTLREALTAIYTSAVALRGMADHALKGKP